MNLEAVGGGKSNWVVQHHSPPQKIAKDKQAVYGKEGQSHGKIKGQDFMHCLPINHDQALLNHQQVTTQFITFKESEDSAKLYSSFICRDEAELAAEWNAPMCSLVFLLIQWNQLDYISFCTAWRRGSPSTSVQSADVQWKGLVCCYLLLLENRTLTFVYYCEGCIDSFEKCMYPYKSQGKTAWNENES